MNNQIAIYEDSNWGINDGEVAGGYLYILNKSLEYWQNEDISGGHGNDIMQPLVLAQVDAAGYLFGWTKAWLWDELPTPNERIKAGLGTAMQFSFVRGLGWVIK